MPLVNSEKESFAPAPVAIGPQLVVVNPQGMTAVPATIIDGGSYSSGAILANGWKAISVGAKLTHAGTISIQRYLDAACTMPVGAAVTATLVANTANWATVNDGVAFVAFIATITNAAGAGATVTYIQIVLGAS